MASTSPASDMTLKVAVVGFGKQGELLVERVQRRADCTLTTVVDVDPAKVGARLDDVAGYSTGADLEIQGSLEAIRGADVALLTTASRMEAVAPQIEAIAALGVNVVTTCEELAYPWRQFPEESARLDEAARAHGISVLGCGANPGFLMDSLPIMLSLGSERIDKIRMRRSLDMRPHRPERLTRFGLGLTPAEFEKLDGDVLVGHVGFTQSMHCLADALGWLLEDTTEEPVRPVVIADEPRSGKFVTLEEGTVAVIEHPAWALHDGRRVIDIAMYFGFHDPSDPVAHGDTYEIEASDQPVSISVQPSWGPFTTTPSTVVNLIRPTCDAAPGLRVVTDFPVRELAARGGAVDTADPLPDHNYLVSMTQGASRR